MRVIGTAGHVDHGKSTLVMALTGINPDRLKEEQAREMTIDLGFAWMVLPDGNEVGIVDVPGHRDFIENMLAGIGGIDAVLFVVAVDEGIMPQTREHLAILDILHIPSGIIVLTKSDLVDDPEWIGLVEGEVRQVVKGTVLAEAPIVRVSARTGTGLDELKMVLMSVLTGQPQHTDLGIPRLPIDRVFTIAGFGTVVTGTLSGGQVRLGDEVEILPSGLHGRIRGLQTHKHKVEITQPGSRVAVNITGIDVGQIHRGDTLSLPGLYRVTKRMDVQFRLLPDAHKALHHNDSVKLFLGTAEVIARLRLVGKDEIHPGQDGWLQVELSDPVVAVRGDRYILRMPSPGETLGGGVVLDPQPTRRYRRFSEPVIRRFEALFQGTPSEILYQAILLGGISPIRELISRARLQTDHAQVAFQELLDNQQIMVLEDGPLSLQSNILVVSALQWQNETQKAIRELEQYHHAYPLRVGMPREELKSRLKLPTHTFNVLLRQWVREGKLAENETLVCLATHTIHLTPQQQARVNHLFKDFAKAPYSPPSIKECRAAVGDELFDALVGMGDLVPVSNDVVYQKKIYEELVQSVESNFKSKGTITVAEFRDQFNTSRRYALAFLEYLDSIGISEREGDIRQRKKPMASNR